MAILESNPLHHESILGDILPLWIRVRNGHGGPLQIPDARTANHFYTERHPQQMSINQLWEKIGAQKPFQPTTWHYFTRYSGTDDMYTDIAHKLSVHGDGHKERVKQYAYILGQYKGLSDPAMKVLLTAADIHDRARTDDQDAPNHGLDAAKRLGEYVRLYQKRGITFTTREIMQIGLLCLYHEKPQEQVLEFEDERMNLLLQILQAADAADRFRLPSKDWWPQAAYFDTFFGNNNTAQDAFLNFAAYLTLSSEHERFMEYSENPHSHVEDAIRAKSQETGIISEEDASSDALRRLV